MYGKYTIFLKTNSKTYEDIKHLLKDNNLRYITEYNISTGELKIEIRIEDISIDKHLQFKCYQTVFPNDNIKLIGEVGFS